MSRLTTPAYRVKDRRFGDIFAATFSSRAEAVAAAPSLMAEAECCGGENNFTVIRVQS